VRLSVGIITKNEEETLPRLLESLKDFADEVVVLDSGSTDRTVKIARDYGAKVFIDRWEGFARQRQKLFDLTAGEWILFLDADEVPDKALKSALRREIQNPKADAYFLKRRAVYLGKPMRFLWANEKVLRLVKRGAPARWEGEVHEKLRIEGKVSTLGEGELLHYTYKNLRHHYQKTLLYAELAASQKAAEGYRPTPLDLTLRPLWAFLKGYLLKGGFLDGYRGFLAASGQAVGTFLKYAFILEKRLKD